MHIPIIYEDNHLLVVEKPVNIPVQEDKSQDDDMLSILKAFIKKRDQKPGNVFLGLVHRLDRPVGGVMVFAKTSKAARRLANSLRKNEFERTYLAVVHGVPKQSSGRLEHFLYKDTRKNIVHAVSKNHRQAKRALLEYNVLQHMGGRSLLSVTLHTGRSHQIRVQLATSGFPLYGDQKYGAHVNRPGQQIALWAHTLAFPHVTTTEKNTFQSLPPNIEPWHTWSQLLNERR